jgi:hypothetical protein
MKQTYFEQVPVRMLKDLVDVSGKQDASSLTQRSLRHLLLCRICSLPVPVESAKTDSEGQAIHEQCYLLKATQKMTAPKTRRSQPGL